MIREGILEALQLLLRLDASVIDAATRSLWISIVAVVSAAVAGISVDIFDAWGAWAGA